MKLKCEIINLNKDRRLHDIKKNVQRKKKLV